MAIFNSFLYGKVLQDTLVGYSGLLNHLSMMKYYS